MSIGENLTLKAISKRIADSFPSLRHDLWISQNAKKPEEYIRQILQQSLMVATSMSVLVFLLASKFQESMWWVVLTFIFFFAGFFYTLLNSAQSDIIKKQKEIDKEVLFAGRFLLVKLNSGKPLINAMTDAANSYGVANQYFKSIIHEIDAGTPLEKALDKAIRFSPSKKMKKILFQITNALKIGTDVTKSLEAALDQIAEEQLIEIQRYGKKLNTVTMFYMLGAVVMPSLGLTMFVIVASMMNIAADANLFFVLAFFLLVIEFIFLSVFRQIRPNVNI